MDRNIEGLERSLTGWPTTVDEHTPHTHGNTYPPHDANQAICTTLHLICGTPLPEVSPVGSHAPIRTITIRSALGTTGLQPLPATIDSTKVTIKGHRHELLGNPLCPVASGLITQSSHYDQRGLISCHVCIAISDRYGVQLLALAQLGWI